MSLISEALNIIASALKVLKPEEIQTQQEALVRLAQWRQVKAQVEKYFGTHVTSVVVETEGHFNDEYVNNTIRDINSVYIFVADGSEADVDLTLPWVKDFEKEASDYHQRELTRARDRGPEMYQRYINREALSLLRSHEDDEDGDYPSCLPEVDATYDLTKEPTLPFAEVLGIPSELA